jgi:hypothetical protein
MEQELGSWAFGLLHYSAIFTSHSYRFNAVPSKIDQFNFIGIDYAVLNTSYSSPTLKPLHFMLEAFF